MPAGRPTKYTKPLLKKAWEYLENYADYDHAFPSDLGLARVLGISRSTLFEWSNDPEKTEFSSILEKIEFDQQQVAWNKGLKGEYNANLVKLLLGKHGYSEKNQQEISGPNGGAIQTDNKWVVEVVRPGDKI